MLLFWWEQRQRPLPANLPRWFPGPKLLCAIASASMKPENSAQKCASCRSTKTAGGQRPAIRRARPETPRVLRVQIPGRAKRTAQKKLGINYSPIIAQLLEPSYWNGWFVAWFSFGSFTSYRVSTEKKFEIGEGVFPIESLPFEIHV